MAVNVPIPKLGMSMTRATLIEWKAKEGDWIEKGSVVLTIETEKTGWDITAEASGFLHILVEEGVEVPVSKVVGLIAETKEELDALRKELPREMFTAVVEVKEASPAVVTQIATGAITGTGANVGERIRISPVARKMAEEHMIDILKVMGTGPGGRITKEDIEKAIEEKKKVETTQLPLEVSLGKKVKATIPLKGMRKSIAEHMIRSLSASAQLTVMGEFNATDFVKLRETLLGQEEAFGTRITYTDLLVLAIAKALKEHPLLNSSLINNEIRLWEDINIGVAVSLGEKGDKGLIVPVIKNADQKSILEISKTAKTLIEKARTGKLMLDDVTGGTFTLTSIGSRGVSIFQTPIINQPEVAILGVGLIKDKPVVKNGQIVIALMMPFSLTFDHRVVDGAVAENFLDRLRGLLGTPALLMI
jgi:pyruvate dehydrogenase E2 component (dihydrolipoamide acetyltransferase)